MDKSPKHSLTRTPTLLKPMELNLAPNMPIVQAVLANVLPFKSDHHFLSTIGLHGSQ
jgi:hypothetical protein